MPSLPPRAAATPTISRATVRTLSRFTIVSHPLSLRHRPHPHPICSLLRSAMGAHAAVAALRIRVKGTPVLVVMGVFVMRKVVEVGNMDVVAYPLRDGRGNGGRRWRREAIGKGALPRRGVRGRHRLLLPHPRRPRAALSLRNEDGRSLIHVVAASGRPKT